MLAALGYWMQKYRILGSDWGLVRYLAGLRVLIAEAMPPASTPNPTMAMNARELEDPGSPFGPAGVGLNPARSSCSAGRRTGSLKRSTVLGALLASASVEDSVVSLFVGAA